MITRNISSRTQQLTLEAYLEVGYMFRIEYIIRVNKHLQGSLSISVSDVCYITCPKTKMKVILRYVEEGWLGRTQNKVEGVIFHYDPENDTKTKIKDIPEKDILARIEGSWQDKLYFMLPKSPVSPTYPSPQSSFPRPSLGLQLIHKVQEKRLLIDLNPLFPIPKTIPPEDQQLPNESRRFWHDVTEAIHSREYSKATNIKHQLEERQREKAAARKERNEEWRPRFFTAATTPDGRPDLTQEGERVLRGLQEGDYRLEPAEER